MDCALVYRCVRLVPSGSDRGRFYHLQKVIKSMRNLSRTLHTCCTASQTLTTVGSRAFAVAAQHVWNSLT